MENKLSRRMGHLSRRFLPFSFGLFRSSVGGTGGMSGKFVKDPLSMDLNPARTFSGTTTGPNLPELFRQPGSLEALRPRESAIADKTMDQSGFLEVSNPFPPPKTTPAPPPSPLDNATQHHRGFFSFHSRHPLPPRLVWLRLRLQVYPRAGSKQPRLLTNLEQMLSEKLRANERMVSGPSHGKGSKSAANLRLDAHRQVFEAFVQAFATYKPLLSRIKNEYDAILDDSLRSAHENVVMRAELAIAEQRKNRAVEEARAETAARATALRAELQAHLMDAEERTRAAEKKQKSLEGEVHRLEDRLKEAEKELKELREANQRLNNQILSESTWGEKSLAGTISSMTVQSGKAKTEQ